MRKIPFQVRRRPSAGPAVAVYLPTREVRHLLEFCQHLGLDPSGKVFRVADGYLLSLGAPTTRALPGAIRLRSLSANFHVPVDGELEPALLDEEARGMARDRGWLLLPGGRAYAFELQSPVPLRDLLAVPEAPSRTWRPLPQGRRLYDRIEELLIDRPDESPEDVLDGGAAGPVATEEPHPRETGPASSAVGRAGFSLGRVLTRLGRGFGWQGIVAAGERLMSRAIDMTPNLAEEILGRQAAALRELLREFREGDVERALRKAPPLGEEASSDRGARQGGGLTLQDRDFSYNLRDLIGGRGASRGPVERWNTDGYLYENIRSAYRQAAEQALRRGDYRRAATIFGKLLGDYRLAVNALIRGGLHHDAAVLLLARLDDRRGAAKSFEAAGEVDRALQLYRELGDHEAAGDLLLRVGEEDEALVEYIKAAERMASRSDGLLAAGNLLRDKAKRPDLAARYYADGWSRRPLGSPMTCLIALADIRAEAGDLDEIRSLTDQADAYFEDVPIVTEPGRFYNHLAGLADRPFLKEGREELKDRALMGLAAQLRRCARPGERPGSFFPPLMGVPGVWAAPVVSDATFAVHAVTRGNSEGGDPSETGSGARRVHVPGTLSCGAVTAVTQAQLSGDVILGFDRGQVFGFRPRTSEVVLVGEVERPILSIATDDIAGNVVVLTEPLDGRSSLIQFNRRPGGAYDLIVAFPVVTSPGAWLTPIVDRDDESLLVFWDGSHFAILELQTMSLNDMPPYRGAGAPSAGLLLKYSHEEGHEPLLWFHDGKEWCVKNLQSNWHLRTGLIWRPASPVGCTLALPPMSCGSFAPGLVDLVGFDEEGRLRWGRLQNGDLVARGSLDLGEWQDTRDYPVTEIPQGVALIEDDLLALVSGAGVEWLRPGPKWSRKRRSTSVGLPQTVACFASHATQELLVVSARGTISRVSYGS